MSGAGFEPQSSIVFGAIFFEGWLRDLHSSGFLLAGNFHSGVASGAELPP
jgi:hypothetical protein